MVAGVVAPQQPDPLAGGGWTPTYGGTTSVSIPGGTTAYGSDGSVSVSQPDIVIPTQYRQNASAIVPGSFNSGAGDVVKRLGRQTMETGLGPADTDTAGGVTLHDALLSFMSMPDSSLAQFQTLQEGLIRAGYLRPSRSYTFTPGGVHSGDATYNAYAQLLNDSIIKGKSPQELLAAQMNSKKGAAYWKQYQSLLNNGTVSGLPTEKHYTSTNVQLSTPGDAYKVATDAYQNLLGRDASSKEINALHAALNAYEKKHPTVSSHDVISDPSTGSYDRGGTTSGGVGAGDYDQMAQQQVKSQDGKELGQVQSDRLVQVFEQMLGGHANG